MSVAYFSPFHSPPQASVAPEDRGIVELDVPPRTVPPQFVRRPELVDLLRSDRGARLALIVGPPGYGKTALLAEWAAADDRRFLWLAPNSNSPDCALGPGILEHLDPLGGGCVVVLDDAHLLAGEALRRVLTSLWERLPAESLVAIASRNEPDVPLGHLRAHRALVEIRGRDLSLTPAQAAVLLRRAGIELDFEIVQTLVRRTEGWPAALYLAALSLREQAGTPGGITGFRGDDHLLSEYLRDELVRALPRALIPFMRRASVLERLNADLCAAVMDDRRAGVKLARLARATELLEPRDPAHESFAWHPLLREAMGAELRRCEPELLPVLHKRASRWFEQHDDLDGAIEHAVLAGDGQRAGDLLWSHLGSYLAEGRMERVVGWLKRIGEATVAGDAPLALCAAHCAVIRGDAAAAQRWARHAAAAPPHAEAPGASVALIHAMTSPGGIGGMLSAAREARSAVPEWSPWRPMCSWIEGVAAHLDGTDRAGAATLLERAADEAAPAFPIVAALALAQRAMIAMEDNDWELVAEVVDRAAENVATGHAEIPLSALVFAATAAAGARQGRADEAKRNLRHGLLALDELDDSLAWFGAETRLLLAHASLHLADVVGARSLLARASRQARRAGDSPLFRRWFDDAWEYLDTVAEMSLAGPSGLTIAELRVLRFLPSCRPFREIADQLGVSANTVKTQAQAVYRKLGAASRSEAVLRARQSGLLGE